ncbi:MAG: ABC-2 type transport system permease protein [Planctomycetota bacterium]|jgi:ABC-2 type transport system permease protein
MSASQPTTALERVSISEFISLTLLIAKRELVAYFDSSIAYVYTIAFVVLTNSIFMNEFFLTGTVDMTGFFDLLPFLLAFFLPAITMRLWAEEKKQRTIEVLLTLPIRTIQAVIGKYLAAFVLFALFLLGSIPILVMLFALGDPDPGLIASGYIGVLLFGSLFLALGSFLSALSSDQIVAFVVSTVLGFALVLFGNDQFVAVVDGIAPSLAIGTLLLETISVMPHFDAFVRGALDLSSVLFFVLFTCLFLWSASLVLERDRA